MPAHQRYRYRTTTGSVPQLRDPRIGHSTFQTVAPPLFSADWLQHRSHRLRLKIKATMLLFCRARIELESQL
jgi:hypothetical protein